MEPSLLVWFGFGLAVVKKALGKEGISGPRIVQVCQATTEPDVNEDVEILMVPITWEE